MDDDVILPGSGTYAAPGWGGASTTEPTYTPAREAIAIPGSQSQVPGTSGAPSYTPSATRKKGLPFPAGGYELSVTVGGRRAAMNLRDYEAMREGAGYSYLGGDQSKMHNFARLGSRWATGDGPAHAARPGADQTAASYDDE
jgi:hypothetical protein